jgi:hypothetical protein
LAAADIVAASITAQTSAVSFGVGCANPDMARALYHDISNALLMCNSRSSYYTLNMRRNRACIVVAKISYRDHCDCLF